MSEMDRSFGIDWQWVVNEPRGHCSAESRQGWNRKEAAEVDCRLVA